MNSIPDDRPIPEWFKPLNRQYIQKWARDLPHWEQPEGTYFVTFRMADSVARKTWEKWSERRATWLEKHPKPWDFATFDAYRNQITEKMETLLDSGYGSCLLRNPRTRNIVQDSLLYFEGKRYRIDSLVIMPNHVHVNFQPIEPWTLSKLLHSWKSYSAHQLCLACQKPAPFWMDESFDHLVRSSYYLRKYRDYIFQNPLKAQLSSSEYTYWRRE